MRRDTHHSICRGVLRWALAVLALATATARADDLLVVGMASANLVRISDRGAAVQVVRPGAGGLALAHSIEVGPDGHYIICGFGSKQVHQYDSHSGEFLGVLIDDGDGGLDTPTFAKIGPDGLLYVSSYYSNEVLRFEPLTGQFIDVFITAGSGGIAQPETPFWRNGLFYLIDGRGNRVLRYDAVTGDFVDQFIDAQSTGGQHLHTLLWLEDGSVLVDGFESGDVQRFDEETGDFIEVLIKPGTGGLSRPHGMAIGPDDGLLYISSAGTDNILRFDVQTGSFVDMFASLGPSLMNVPASLMFVESRNLKVLPPFPGVAGRTNLIAVRDAEPGAIVTFWWSDRPGTMDVPGCLGMQLDMRHPRRIGYGLADEFGRTSIQAYVPYLAAEHPVVIQAVDWVGCRSSQPLIAVFE